VDSHIVDEAAASEPPSDSADAPLEFPLSEQPDVIQEFIGPMAERHGVPPQLYVAAAIGVTSAACGKGVRMHTIFNLTTFANLYVWLAGPSGWGKTIGLRPIFAPIHDFQQLLWARKASMIAELEQQLDAAEQELSKARTRDATSRAESEAHRTRLDACRQEIAALATQLAVAKNPDSATISVDDITTERLVQLLAANRGVIACISTDARGVIKNIAGRYRSAGHTDEQVWVSCYSGDRVRQDRITRTTSIIEAPIVSMTTAIQPDLFDAAYAEGVLAESGFLCRVVPCCVYDYPVDPRYDDTSDLAGAKEFHAVITDLLTGYHQSEKPVDVTMSPGARELLFSFKRTVDEGIRQEYSSIAAFAARWTENAAKICLCFHCLEHGARAHLNEVAEDTMRAAARTMNWFAEHQSEILQTVTESKQGDLLSSALELVSQRRTGISARDVYRKKQSVFRSVAAARSALEQLRREGTVELIVVRKARLYIPAKAPSDWR
jgi:ribosomal protein L29